MSPPLFGPSEGSARSFLTGAEGVLSLTGELHNYIKRLLLINEQNLATQYIIFNYCNYHNSGFNLN